MLINVVIAIGFVVALMIFLVLGRKKRPWTKKQAVEQRRYLEAVVNWVSVNRDPNGLFYFNQAFLKGEEGYTSPPKCVSSIAFPLVHWSALLDLEKEGVIQNVPAMMRHGQAIVQLDGKEIVGPTFLTRQVRVIRLVGSGRRIDIEKSWFEVLTEVFSFWMPPQAFVKL